MKGPSKRYGYGYRSYRGRPRSRSILTAIIAVLVVVLLALVVSFFLLKDHVVYDENGKAHIALVEKDAIEVPSPTPSATAPVEPTPEPTPTPEPEPEEEALHLVSLPVSALTDGTALAQVQAAGGNGAVFEMKAVDGTLSYVSALPISIQLGSSASDPALNAALTAGNAAEGLYTVAKLSCFLDDLAPKQNNRLAIRSPIGNWRDPNGVRYLSPAVSEVQSYLSGICRELAELGFDEIWLDSAAYPLTGELGYIQSGDRYPSDKSPSLTAFYQAVETALSDYPDVKVGLTCSAQLLTAGQDTSGMTTALLQGFAQRLYAPAPVDTATAGQYAATRESLGLSETDVVYTTDTTLPHEGGSLIQP